MYYVVNFKQNLSSKNIQAEIFACTTANVPFLFFFFFFNVSASTIVIGVLYLGKLSSYRPELQLTIILNNQLIVYLID